jgi:hypothetical protein
VESEYRPRAYFSSHLADPMYSQAADFIVICLNRRDRPSYHLSGALARYRLGGKRAEARTTWNAQEELG